MTPTGRNGYRHRWRLLHAIGPVLVAAFANSPLRGGRPTGWLSSRQQVWSRMDPGRTRPPMLGPDPREAWARYALDAQLMCVRNEGSADWSAPAGLTLRDWVRGDAADRMRPPTAGDLEYHLSTLFPPVRPHGHLELRMIDAQRGDGWIVPLAVVTALFGDDRAGDDALAAVERLWAGHGPASGRRASRTGTRGRARRGSGRPTRPSPRPAGSASRRRGRRLTGWRPPRRSPRRLTTSSNTMSAGTDVQRTIYWRNPRDRERRAHRNASRPS